jgi:hypothetical protein
VFHQGERVAAHARTEAPGEATTLAAHRPPSHQKYLEWTPARLREWATHAGPATAQVIARIFQSRPHVEQSLRAGLGLRRLGERFGPERLEAACARALRFDSCSYPSVQLILQRGLDRPGAAEPTPTRPALVHQNLRGADYFASGKEAPYVD